MRTIKGPKDPEVGAILAEMSNIKVWLEDFDGAEVAARAAVETYQTLPIDYPDRVMAEYYLADLFLNRGDIEEAAPIFERVLASQRRLYGKIAERQRTHWHPSPRYVSRRRISAQRRR